MNKATKIILALVAIIVALALAAPFFIPTDVYKTQIIAAVERSTGRTLTIEGDISLKLFPTAEFVAEDVTLSNAQGATDPLMAEMEALTIGVNTMGLLSRNIEITKFILRKPTLSLEVMKSEKANWEFEAASKEQDTARTDDADSVKSGTQIKSLIFGDLRIIDGTITDMAPLLAQPSSVCRHSTIIVLSE